VIELLDATSEEAESAIREAFAEGYKAGLLETAPERDYWKSLAESWQREAAFEATRFRLPLWALPVAAASGAVLAFAVTFAVGR